MAEFVRTMRDWRRMCKAQEKLRGDRACCGCPLEGYGCPSIYDDDDNTDYANVATKVEAWAAEHQEPVYPTWDQYLLTQGFPEKFAMTGCVHDNCDFYQGVVWLGKTHIPAGIAEKLGIEPKEE